MTDIQDTPAKRTCDMCRITDMALAHPEVVRLEYEREILNVTVVTKQGDLLKVPFYQASHDRRHILRFADYDKKLLSAINKGVVYDR
jgi:hypothetical protein